MTKLQSIRIALSLNYPLPPGTKTVDLDRACAAALRIVEEVYRRSAKHGCTFGCRAVDVQGHQRECPLAEDT